jgi:hypothetical protein
MQVLRSTATAPLPSPNGPSLPHHPLDVAHPLLSAVLHAHLRENLALAHDQRVQAAGHAHEMVRGVAVTQQEQVGAQLL